MTPYAKALELYRGDTRRFTDELELHFLHGYVVATPEAFAMARPIRADWDDPARVADISQVEPLASANCWFIWLLAGDLLAVVRWLPVELPLIGFSRQGSEPLFRCWRTYLTKLEQGR